MAKVTLELDADFASFLQGMGVLSTSYSDLIGKNKEAKEEADKAFTSAAESVSDLNTELHEVITSVDQTGKKISDTQKKIETAFSGKEIRQLNSEVKTLGKSIETSMDGAEKKTKSLKGQLRDAKQELALMEQEGKDNTIQYEKMLIAAARLEDQIGDVQERVRALSSDTAGLDAFVQAGQGIAAGFAVAQGAAALFGEDNEELQKTLIKLSAAQAILNGVQEIGQLITGQSALKTLFLANSKKILGVASAFVIGGLRKENAAVAANTVAQEEGAVANNALANSQKILTVSTGLSSRAMRIFRLALLGTGIGAIIVGIGLLIEHFDKIVAVIGKFTGLTEESGIKSAEVYAQMSEQAKNASEAFKKEIDVRISLIKDEHERKIAEIKEAGRRELQAENLTAEGRKLIIEKMHQDILAEEKRAADEKEKLALTNEERRIKATKSGINEQLALFDIQTKREIKQAEEAGEDVTLVVALRAKERRKIIQDNNDKRNQEQKKKDDEALKIQKDFEDKSLDLTRKFRDSEVKTEEQQIERSAELALEEVVALEKELRAKGKLTKDQEEQIAKLRINILNDANRKQNDLIKADSIAKLDAQKDLAIAQVDQLKNQGLEEEAFTQLKEEKKLEIQIEFAKKRIALLEQAPGNELQIEQLKAEIVKAQDELKKLEDQDAGFNIFKLFGLDPKSKQFQQDLALAKEAISHIGNLIGTVNDARIAQNEQNISALDEQIKATEEAVKREQEARKQGLANNLEDEQENLAILQEERQKAADEQRKLQQQKLNLEAIEQASSLITASANIFKATSGLGPIGVGLAVISIGAMFAAFIAAQKQARDALKAQQFREGGKLEFGRSHEQGGHRIEGTNMEVEGGEWVLNKASSRKYDRLAAAINADNFKTLSTADLMPLLAGTGVTIQNDIPQRMGSGNQVNYNFSDRETRNLRSDFNRFAETHNKREYISETNDHILTQKGGHTRRIKK